MPRRFATSSASFGAFLATLAAAALAAPPALPLGVSENGRYLVDGAGEPFFWLGDTAWELVHRLTREEIERYLADRAEKGFTVVHTVALAEFDGLAVPNAYGHLPLEGLDPARPRVVAGPENDYGDHVEWTVRRANEHGMVVGLLPTWGDKWNKKWGVGPEVFTPENARAFGRFVGERFRDAAVIWVLGGDRNPDTPGHYAIVDALAEGIGAGDGGRGLVTYHPQGDLNAARTLFSDRRWLDVQAFQSGHGIPYLANYEVVQDLVRRGPARPVIDCEPCYEDHSINWKPAELGWYDEWHVRTLAYWSMFSGAAGHTYGNHNIWQLYAPGREPVGFARTPWQAALDHPGAFQMARMKALLTARPWWDLWPADELILSPNPRGDGAPDGTRLHRVACRDGRGRFVMVYLPRGGEVTVDLRTLVGGPLRAWWFDPRQGTPTPIDYDGPVAKAERREFRAPSRGRNNDWVLVLDAAEADLPEFSPWGA